MSKIFGLLFLRPEPGLYIVCFLIINGLVGFSIYINIKLGAKLLHFHHINVEKSTLFDEFSPLLLNWVCKTAIIMLFSRYYADVGPTWGRRRPRVVAWWSGDDPVMVPLPSRRWVVIDRSNHACVQNNLRICEKSCNFALAFGKGHETVIHHSSITGSG